ncbi:M14 family metallopeptidase [Zhouia amylolytica]|nr:M14 metallopeptidase family protein [Zhouia amylolytica]MCQ0112723.1 DUF2817 domain-containing protein [Zhouia amylolytica]
MNHSLTHHEQYLEKQLHGRYIHMNHIEKILKNLPDTFTVSIAGRSVKDQPIYTLKAGNGPIKVLMWSQMHGNESTTTKAVFDLLKLLQDADNHFGQWLMEKCTVLIMPMLNPDGSEAYTRVNANNIDLNRDAQNLSQPESKVLRTVFNEFEPDYCFNLHDQRTIFSAGSVKKPATVSFLSPSEDINRSVTETRKKSMEVIVAMNKVLQGYIPGQIGRYDDGFNLNCVGDTFQSLGVPTILFESGHFPDDYLREETRKYIFIAICTALEYIAEDKVTGNADLLYAEIPENDKCFLDIIVRKTNENGEREDVGILFKETLIQDKLHLLPTIEKTGDLKEFYGHIELQNAVNSTKSFEIKGFGRVDITEILKNRQNS